MVALAAVAVLVAAPPGARATEPRGPGLPLTEKIAKGDRTAFRVRIGNEAPMSSVRELAMRLRAATLPSAGGAEADLPLFAVLESTGTPEEPRFEVAGLAMEIAFVNYGRIRLDDARVALMPSADGRSCRFELSGAPLAVSAALEVRGTVEWGAGPLGGHRVQAEYRIDGVPVEALRAVAPTRFDPSLGGLLSATGKVDGVLGEESSEMAPATPLRGTFEAGLDWTVLGRRAPLSLQGQFSIDDRMIRVAKTKASWGPHALDVRGWTYPGAEGKYQVVGEFEDVDTAAVARDWGVPEPWVPEATVSGRFVMEGKAGSGRLSYEARTPLVTVPGLGGWDLRAESPKLKGSLQAVNADVSLSTLPERFVVGGIDLGPLGTGVRWWRDKLTVSASNTRLWDGDNDATVRYVPAEHPAFSFSGRVEGAEAEEVLASLLPELDVAITGNLSAAYTMGQDADRKPVWSAYASLTSGTLAFGDLFAQLFDALAAADPALAPADAVEHAPRPYRGLVGRTRADRLFFELARRPGGYDIGRLILGADEFQLDADGTVSLTDGIDLRGTLYVPPLVAERMIASAPWLAGLQASGERLFVPVVLRGPTSAPRLSLGDGYGDLLARARGGEPVEAPGAYEARRVAIPELARIPGDPELFAP